MTSIIIGIIAIAIVEATIKNIDIFDEFISGVREGMQLVYTLFPSMMAFMLWVTCFQTCGIIQIMERILQPVFTACKIPAEILMMMFIRPISSNGSMSMMASIYKQYGVDHPYSILASIIQTGSDTTFYVVTLYFSSVKMQCYRYALKLGLFLDMIACLLALLCYHVWIV